MQIKTKHANLHIRWRRQHAPDLFPQVLCRRVVWSHTLQQLNWQPVQQRITYELA